MPTIPNFPADLSDEHHAWHMFPGGAHGLPSRQIRGGQPGSGIEFLTFHRGYTARFHAWYDGQPFADQTLVAPWRQVPQALRNHPRWSTWQADVARIETNPTSFATADAHGIFIERGVHDQFLHPVSSQVFNEPLLNDVHSPQITQFYGIHGLVDTWWDRWVQAQGPGGPPPVPLVVGAAPLQGALTQPGEIDRYELLIAQSGNYVIETAGTTDVVMSLFRLGNLATPIAQDDDGGPGTNARIQRDLTVDTYRVFVRHFNTNGAGAYSITARTATTNGQTAVDLPVNGAAVAGEITVPNEQDLYRFQAPSAGSYTIQTTGNTDVVMTLLGPDTTTQIAMDDDSGPGRNPLITQGLTPGTYFVRVRGWRTTTGPYSITVTN